MNPLFDIQDMILNHLRQQDIFRASDIHWILRQEGQLLSDIDAGQSQLKMACFVYPPLPGDANPNSPSLEMTESSLRITWFEHYELTKDYSIHIDRFAIETLRILHHWQPPGNATLGFVTLQPSQPIEWQVTKQGLQQIDCWLQAPIVI